MEGFNDLLLKLREAHDREVEGWQVKVQELSNKKGCDTKRMEELFTRNQQMKEQQRILIENMKTLENRLRAGLCDRCTVTQDVAKRRQQEYEASQMQSLQHISLLAGEMNNLKKENKRLRDEIRTLRAALDRGQSDHSSNGSTATEVKPNSSPDLPPSPGPVALISMATSRASNQPADGDVAVKTEAEHRTEENRHENRHLREWHKSLFESYKPLSPSTSTSPSWKTQHSVPRIVERRAQGVEGQDQQLSNSSSRKSSPSSSASGEVNPSRPVHVHAPIPCRPHPVKSSPWPLTESSDWIPVAAAGTNLVGHHSKPNLPRFPNLIATSQHANHSNPRRVFGAPWSKQSGAQAPAREPTVVFRLRSILEQTERQTRPQEKKDIPPPKAETVSEEGNNKEVCEGPLDLSDPGRTKSIQREDSPLALQGGERVEESPEGGVKESSAAYISVSSSSPVAHPLSASTPPVKQQEEPSNDHNHKLVIKLLKPKEEVNGKTHQSDGKKVPVRTVSLRPVVVLESLNSALQKQESSTSNHHVHNTSQADPPSPEVELGSSSEEKEEEGSVSGQENNQGCKRKRASVETETDRDSDADNIQQERKIKITLRSEEKSPS